MKAKEIPEIYQPKREILSRLENLFEQGLIDLCCGDQARVSVEPCLLYGWRFADEEVSMPAAEGAGLNCFALLQRNNQGLIETCEQTIASQFIFERLEEFSTGLKKLTVVVLDNARIRRSLNNVN